MTPRTSRPLWLLLLLGSLAATGCKRETVTYSVTIDVAKLPRSGLRRILFRGQEVPFTMGPYSPQMLATFSAPGEQWLSGDMHALQLEIETPCGPTRFDYTGFTPDPVVAAGWLLSEEKKFRPGSESVKLDFHLDPLPATLFVHVDRREAESAEVALGKQVLKRGAGLPRELPSAPPPEIAGDVYEVAVPNVCVEGPDVTVAGQKVGRLGASGINAHAVIDVKGGHCYDRVQQHYVNRKDANSGLFKPERESISGQRVFISEGGPNRNDTDAVLVACPDSAVNRFTCYEVRPVPCTP